MLNDNNARSTAERLPGDREPKLDPDEEVQLDRIAERLSLLGRTPGRLVLTNRRLIFEPSSPLLWYSRLRMPRTGAYVRQSGHIRRFVHRLIEPGIPPTYLHTADIKVGRGRKAAWFRVYDTEEWERALAKA